MKMKKVRFSGGPYVPPEVNAGMLAEAGELNLSLGEYTEMLYNEHMEARKRTSKTAEAKAAANAAEKMKGGN